MAKSEMIFMCNAGSKLNTEGPIGLVMDGHTLPVAFCDTGDCEEVGFEACWQSLMNVEDFFSALRIEDQNAPGLFYVCAVFDHEDDVSDDGEWEHLADMSCEHLASMEDFIVRMLNEAEYGKRDTCKWHWA